MALTFVAGDKSFSLSREELQSQPGSLLHSLVSSVPSDDGPAVETPATLKLDELTGSPLATWPEAIHATTALYRKEPMSVQMLSDLLKTNTEEELYNKLQGLLDYLGIDAPVTVLLPSMSSISLLHVGVLGLHYHSLTKKAVDLMMTSTAFNCTSIDTQLQNAAYFYITAKGGQCSIDNISVYAVGGVTLCRSPPPSGTAMTDVGELQAVVLPRQRRRLTTPSRGILPLSSIVSDPHTYGFSVSADHRALGGRIMAALQEVVGGVPVDGHTGVMRAKCITASASYCGSFPLWLLHW